MDAKFREDVLQLVAQHHGNQREAVRASGISPSVINDAVRGIGPKYPRPETWDKLRKALGRLPAAVHEDRGEYLDKFDRLCAWVRQHPERFDFFERAAREFGYDDKPPEPKAHEPGVHEGGATMGAVRGRGAANGTAR